MSDNRSRHDRLAVRLSLIISRLMAGESLSLKTLSDEFGVTERTLQRDFHQRLVHLDLEYRNGRYSLRRQSSPGAIPEMLSFIQNTGIARILPLRNGRLITCLTDNQEPSPCLIWLPVNTADTVARIHIPAVKYRIFPVCWLCLQNAGRTVLVRMSG